MKLSALQRGSSRVDGSGNRRGVLTAWTIWIMLASGVVVGCLFNIIWMSAVRNDARNCSASAALAAGQSYLSDDILRSWQQTFEYDGRVARCQNAAISIVEFYRKQNSLPPITAEHVQIQWPETEVAVKDPSNLVPTKISVGFDHDDKSSQIPLFFSGLTGVSNAKLGVCSTVILEHAPAAFQPGPGNTVPMLPFAITDQASVNPGSLKPVSSGHWTSNIESGKGRDCFSWNNETRLFENGPDGLPEVTVTIYSGATTIADDAFVPLSFCAANAGQASGRIPEWIDRGLSEADVKSLGMERVSFPSSLPTALLALPQQSTTVAALQKKIGEPCIICLCTANRADASTSFTVGTVSLKRPVAARLVQVTTTVKGNVKVTLQPCVLVTSTAITANDTPIASNRYVYSVRLCN